MLLGFREGRRNVIGCRKGSIKFINMNIIQYKTTPNKQLGLSYLKKKKRFVSD